MQFNPLTIVLTIVGGLVVAGLLGWIRRPRLVVLLPRTFSYSQIANQGQLAEISVFNRGFKTEESIDVALNHLLTYELLGSNSQHVQLDGNRLKISRIGPSDEVTALLLVEKGSFGKSDIVQCLSKETKGALVSRLDEVPPTGMQRVALVAGGILVPLSMYGFTVGVDYYFERRTEMSAQTGEKNSREITIGSWQVSRGYRTASPALFAHLSSGAITVEIGQTSSRGDITSVPVKLINKTDQVLRFNVDMTTANSSKRFKSFELTTGEVVVVPNRTEERTVKVVVPEGSKDRNERMIFLSAFIQNISGESLILKASREPQ